MSVIWEKKNNQGQFVEIPCIEDLFTCNYTDVCELMDQIVQCPDPLVAAGIPCQCPITKVGLICPYSWQGFAPRP